MQKTEISWTDATWNPVRGCTKVSPGCLHCYAETFAERWRGIPGHAYEQGFDLRLVPEKLHEPLSWKKPKRIFVNSMSDLFHKEVPDEFILRVFDVMRQCTWSGGQGCGSIGGAGHIFQVLTKRAERMRDFMQRLRWTGESLVLDKAIPGGLHSMMQQIWLGVSVEDQKRADERIPLLLKTPAAVRFLSCEPLLGPVNLRRGVYAMLPVGASAGTSLEGIHWAIVGGESGHGARPMLMEWAEFIVSQCQSAGVPVFMKQLGAHPRRLTGAGVAETIVTKDKKGGDWSEWPESLRVREFPTRKDTDEH